MCRHCILSLLLLLTRATAFSSPKKVERVAIIGTGISGLAVAHALRDSGIKLEMFEARPVLDHAAGAGVQLNGGLKVLGDINPDLQKKVIQAGLPLSAIQSRTKSWFGRDKEYSTLFELDIAEILESNEDLLQDGKPLWISIMRGALQKILYDDLEVPVHLDKRLTNLVSGSNGVKCEFADGTASGPFDLVVGCDGTRSLVKEYVDSGKISDGTGRDAIYSGIRIRYATGDDDTNTDREGIPFTQYFGNGAYALHAYYGNGPESRTKAAFLIYLDENFIGPFRRKSSPDDPTENVDWKPEPQETCRAMLEQLREASIPDKDNDLTTAINNANQIFELGCYFHNPFKRWSRVTDTHAVILCGDAAHSFPPFLGQGANQALQDAFCLVERVKGYNEKIEEGERNVDLQQGLDEYQKIRWLACFNIFWKSVFLGYLETGGGNGIYAKFRDAFFNALGIVGVPAKVLLSAATPKVE